MARAGWPNRILRQGGFQGCGAFRSDADSEYVPPPQIDWKPYDPVPVNRNVFAPDDPFGWRAPSPRRPSRRRPPRLRRLPLRLLPPLVGSPDGLQLGVAPGEECGRRTEGMSHSGFLVCRALMGR